MEQLVASIVVHLGLFGVAYANPITAENIEAGRIGLVKRAIVNENRGFGQLEVTVYDKRGDSIDVLVTKYPAGGIGAGKVLPANTVWSVWGVVPSGRDKGKYILQPVFTTYAPPKVPPPVIKKK